MSIGRLALPPPRNWQDFQVLCCALWKEIWRDPDTQQNGRQGQAQKGVDIYGRPDRGPSYAGVQCKGRENCIPGPLSEVELLTEVEKAKEFEPPLSELIVATTGPRDEAIQTIARKLTETHQAQGLFSVTVYSWDDILEQLLFHPKLIKAIWPDYSPVETSQIAADLDEIKATQRQILSNQEAQPPAESHPIKVAVTTNVRVELPDSGLVPEFQAELDVIRDQIRSFRAKDALTTLEKLRERVWRTPHVNDFVKFRVITNQGAALLHLGRNQEAARRFLEALPYNPTDTKALLNASTAQLLLKDTPQAIEAADKVITKDPLNAHAHSLRIQARMGSISLEEMLDSVPKSVRDSMEVAHALGEHARRLGDLAKAEEWFRIALAADKEASPDLIAALGEVLLARALALGRRILLGANNEETIRLAEEAIQLFETAWAKVADTDMAPQRANILANRALARSYLGRRQDAIGDLTLALRYEPDSKQLKRNLAILYYENDDDALAEKLLLEVVPSAEAPEGRLILAEVRRKQKNFEGALNALDDHIAQTKDPALILEGRRARIELLGEMRELGKAREEVQRALADHPGDAVALTLGARIERISGDSDRALALLRDGLVALGAEPSSREAILLADELYHLQRWDEALPLYEKYVDQRVDSPHVRRLANASVLANRADNALKLCLRFLETDAGRQFFANLAAVIYEQIGDLPHAREVCERYLKKVKKDDSIGLRLAILDYRAGNHARVDAYLNAYRSASSLSLEERIQIAELCALRGQRLKTLEVLYDARRAFSGKADAHTAYFSNFFRVDRDDMPELHVGVVAADLAVQVKDEQGTLRWYVIEDRPDADPLKSELPIDGPLAKLLLGKKVGDAVELSANHYSRERVTITELKSKYVHALHETLESFNKWFPGDNRLIRFSGIDPEKPDSIGPILESVSRRAEMGEAISKEYSQGHFTIGAIVQLTSSDVIQALASLASQDHGVWCCNGDPQERAQAIAAIEAASVVVLDPTTLACAHGLNLLPFLKRLPTRLVVTQSTRDHFLAGLDHQRVQKRGFMTLSKEDGLFYRREVTKEEIEASIKVRQQLIDWIDANCEVLPVQALLTFDRAQKKQLDDCFGETFIESALLAAETGGVILSEDFPFRQYSTGAFKTRGAWLHSVFLVLQKKALCSSEEYLDATERIVAAGLRPITVNADVLIHAARRAGWIPTKRFLSALRMLRTRNCDPVSAIQVGAITIYALYKQPALREQRFQLIWAILDAISDHPNPTAQVDSLRTLFERQLSWLPSVQEEIVEIITAWKAFRKGF